MEFSHDDSHLLTGGRDRNFNLYARNGPFEFSLIKHVEAHLRIIWAVSWASNDEVFATGSRGKNKNLKIWNGIGSSTLGE